MKRRVLVSQTRVPEIDRDRGSQRVDTFIRWFLEDGWAVTFLAEEETADPVHVHRLRQLGVATFAGHRHADELIAAGGFDLAVLAFWQPASELIPRLRAESPQTRVVVDSIDLHFLRDARRRFGVDGELDTEYGDLMVRELNTYRAADAVLTVSEKESGLLADLLGPDRVHDVPLTEELTRSEVPFRDRRGILFVGNFRHLPNGEAVEFLCRDVLPRLDPQLLADHPLTVVGNRLDDKVRAHATGLGGVRMVGWVPSVIPYFQQARVCAVPLLHGAGVKGKVIQALMLGTPVVTTPIGAEGLDLAHDVHALIADTPQELAAAVTRTLTDEATWHRLADAGAASVATRYDATIVRDRFRSVVDGVLAAPPLAPADGFRHGRRRANSYRVTKASVRDVVHVVTDPGATVLVVSKGDNALVELPGRTGWHFPRAADGRWAGHHPVDGAAAIRDLELLRDRGARYLVFPSTSFWWFHHYRELTAHLEERARRVHADEHVVVFDLAAGRPAADFTGSASDDGSRPHVLVLGRYGAGRAGPPPALVTELGKSRRFAVTQRWWAHGAAAELSEPDPPDAGPDPAWVVFVDDTAVLPSRFLDDFLSLQDELGVECAQPAHAGGPTAGPPVTERLRGCVARHLAAPTPLPLLSVRGDSTRVGAPLHGAVTVIDEVAISLARTIADTGDPPTGDRVVDVSVHTGDGLASAVRRSALPDRPAMSVLVTTYERPELLSAGLEAFCEQTISPSEFEVVVVDDGSSGTATAAVFDRFADRLPLVWVRIDHAGRSAAKNLAVLLARSELVLFFDDDDRPAPSLLEKHLAAHRQHPEDGVAILGFTDWAPELPRSPVMHYLTDVDKMLFSYGNLEDGQELDWRGFWEGRISCKRALLVRHGLHDQRLDYSIDVELGYRLAPHGLRVVYRPAAKSVMARPIDFDGFCTRFEAKGRAQALIAMLHDGDDEVRRYTRVDDAEASWDRSRARLASVLARVRELEAALPATSADGDPALAELHRCYREAFMALNAKGVVETQGRTDAPAAPAAAPALPDRRPDRGAPELTVTIPVWSRTPELADMAVRTVERVWEAARLSTEVVVVDNGSPHQRDFDAVVHRFEENRGVATAWNTGIGIARSPLVAVLNSDCLVEPGWDEALAEAALTARRIAFPYTDHDDGRGFRQPDQAGTAGWCFMLAVALYREIGPFDERFNPAYCEDTDYWHRAWELGIELSPVPAAHVTHARRTTASHDPHYEWLLQGHRYKYGWKHGVDPLRAPPYYNRTVLEYHCRGRTNAVTT